ncbi:MAG TPA: sugar phosphate nucleotidyltransferase, partial [Opitutaceae bacterium]|nr:sugar phosphate nucleotidyltransferase [Opitutaceae bacterium]
GPGGEGRSGTQLEADTLLTFGIRPSFPATGFGYLELGPERAFGSVAVRRVDRFVEKPDGATAKSYVESGRFVWNAGMFVWRADGFLAEAERSAPELARFIREFPHRDRTLYIRERFPALPRISVDYAIMEKARSVATILAEFDWDDVGAWSALPNHLPADEAGNTLRGPVAAVDAAGNIAVSNGRLIALCGVQDLVVVETPDAILVCHRDRVQDIKRLQPLLPKELQ